MKAERWEREGLRYLRLSGHVSAGETDVLVGEFAALGREAGARAVLDLALLKNLPTAVIGSLIALIRALEASGGRLVVAAPSATVLVPLDRLGVSPMVRITESVAEAEELLRS
jgi:anti-anti-sigma regulatory factor